MSGSESSETPGGYLNDTVVLSVDPLELEAKVEEMMRAEKRGEQYYQLLQIFSQLGDQEVEVLLEIARRVLKGQEQYGRFRLEVDGRDFEKEGDEELRDYLVYRALMKVKARL